MQSRVLAFCAIENTSLLIQLRVRVPCTIRSVDAICDVERWYTKVFRSTGCRYDRGTGIGMLLGVSSDGRDPTHQERASIVM